MGVISQPAKKENKGPECPLIFTGLMDKYRSLKFIRRIKDDVVNIYPRDMLTWHDLESFQRVSGHKLSMLESELIMGIEGIFEGRDDG